MAESEVEEAARRVLEPFSCDDCEFIGSSRASLAQHRRARHPRPRAGAAGELARPSDAVVDAVIGKTVANLQVLGGYLSIVLPHTGLAIAGVPGPREGDPPVVASRALVAGRVLGQWAQRDARVLQALDRFNRLFETSEVVELAGALGAAIAVDVGAVPADLAIEVGPFVGERAIQPVRAVIGDVVDYVASLRPPAPAANGRADVPDQGWRAEATGAAPAHEVERGTVVEGDVTDT